MKSINALIETKKKGLSLFMEVAVDGRAVYEGEANSLIGNFARLLYNRASQFPIAVSCVQTSFGFNNAVTNVTQGTANRVRLHTTSNSVGTGQSVYVYGIQGIPALTPGLYEVSTAGTSGGSNYVELTGTEGFDISGWVANSGGYIRSLSSTPSRNNASYYQQYTNPEIYLGTGNTAVVIEDRFLAERIPNGEGPGQLVHGSMAISLPAVTTGQSEITFSRQFTNNSGSTIQVKEIGLLVVPGESTSLKALIARDLLEVSIGDGSTVTVSYKLRTVADADGGTMIQFNELFTRAFRGEDREAKDVYNNNRLLSRNFHDFMMGAPAGDQPFSTGFGINTTIFGYDVGPTVGTGDDPVTQTNYQLHTKVPHTPITSPNDDALTYFGSFVDGFVEDTDTDVCEFKVHRAFYNPGNNNVVVTEVGLQVGGGFTTVSSNEFISYAYLIARNLLGEGNEVTIEPGDYLLLTYTFRVSL